MATRQVTGTITDLDGTPQVGVYLAFRSTIDTTANGAAIVRSRFGAQTDASGAFAVTLTTGVSYEVAYDYGSGAGSPAFIVMVPEGATPIDFATLPHVMHGEARPSSPGANTTVSVGTSSTQLVAANPQRITLILRNKGTASVFLGFGVPAVVGSGYEMEAGEGLDEIKFRTSVNAIAAADTINVAVFEEVR